MRHTVTKNYPIAIFFIALMLKFVLDFFFSIVVLFLPITIKRTFIIVIIIDKIVPINYILTLSPVS